MSLLPLPEGWQSWDSQTLAAEIAAHNRNYWDRAAPTISDYDYDRLIEQLRTVQPQAVVLSALGPTQHNTAGDAVAHLQAMLSLDKAYDEKTLLHWATKFEGALVMTPKVDGVACSIRYDEHGQLKVAATRGSGAIGEDITTNVRRIQDVPTDIPSNHAVEIRGEVYLPISTFKALPGDFANPRNTAAGALKQKDADRSAKVGLRFFAYDVIGPQFETEIHKYSLAKEWGFNPVEHRLVSREQVQTGYDEYVIRRNDLDFEIDGVVYKANRLDEQARLGATAHHPRYAIAYKLQGESASTILREVQWSVSRTGALTPVGLVDPVLLSGATVTRISLHNWGLVQSKNLTLNAHVIAMRRGGVIPHLENVVEPGDQMIFPPTTCPSCGCKPVIDGEFIQCSNVTDCPAQAVGALVHFAKVTGIEGFGHVWLETLVKAQVLASPADFYRLDQAKLETFERMGPTLAEKLIGQIEAARELPLVVFLQALGVPDLGKTASETVAESFKTLDSVLSATPGELLELPKFGVLLAERIARGLAHRSGLIATLCEYVTVQDTQVSQPVFGHLTGQSFLFTGTLTQMSRNEAQGLVKTAGGTAASGVSKNLSYLVVGDAGQAGSKLRKAEAAGVKVLSEAEFMVLVGAS
jgi:DNA ligase (NAD+)